MSNVMMIVIGLLIAAAAGLMTVYYGTDVFSKYSDEAEAARLVSEGAQVEAAVELYYRQEGKFPDANNPVEELISSSYLSHRPKGADYITGEWVVDYDEGHIRATVGPSSDEEALEVCRTARRQLKMPDWETVYQCDGSDSPSGTLSSREPCCIRNPD